MAKNTPNTDSTVIDLEDEVASAPAGVQASAVPKGEAVKVGSVGHDVGFSGRKVRITIHDGKDDIDRLPVNISINGYAYQINRNASVVVPIEVLEVLENAKEDRYEFSKDGGVRQVTVMRFAYTNHGEVTA